MTLRRLFAIATLPLLVACGSGGSSNVSDAGVTPADANRCLTFESEHEEILNAPTDSTVIRKTPAHPPVGDAGLP